MPAIILAKVPNIFFSMNLLSSPEYETPKKTKEIIITNI